MGSKEQKVANVENVQHPAEKREIRGQTGDRQGPEGEGKEQ